MSDLESAAKPVTGPSKEDTLDAAAPAKDVINASGGMFEDHG